METVASEDSNFEQQFQHKEKLTFPEGKVTVVDVSPEVLTDSTPVIIAPGWSENYYTYRKTLKVAFDSGRRILTVGYFQKGGEEPLDTEYPEVELRKARLLLDALESKGIKKTDVIAHSEGAINTLIAAMLEPDQFRNVVLDKPAGLIGKDTRANLTGRFLKLILQEAIARPKLFTDPTSGIRAAGRTARYIVENPKRILDEMDVLTNFDITELMIRLWEQGVMFSVISGVNDPLFPVKRQIEHMRNQQEKTGKKPPIEGYYSVKGGHNELSINADKHSSLAIDALNGLQRRRNSIASH